jgi:5-formyltetrahydrofolate cyclo-ligase
MIAGGKVVILPKLNTQTMSFRRFHFTSWDDIVRNDEGYCEPRQGIDGSLDDIDLIIVPSMAISRNGCRVGYGGGYYDNLLRDVYCTKIVLAYEFQIFNSIEAHPHDARIDKIVTERRIIDTNPHLPGFGSN